MALSFPMFWVCPVCFKDFDAGALIDVANGICDGPEPDEGRKLERAVLINVLGRDVFLGRVVLVQF